MTIETLEAIHGLLLREYRKKERAAKKATRVWQDAAENEQENTTELMHLREKLWDEARDFYSVLRDFETHEFH